MRFGAIANSARGGLWGPPWEIGLNETNRSYATWLELRLNKKLSLALVLIIILKHIGLTRMMKSLFQTWENVRTSRQCLLNFFTSTKKTCARIISKICIYTP